MSTLKSLSEADILDRLIRPGAADMSPMAAEALLQLKFDKVASKAIERLLRANAAGTISTEDRLLLDRYLRVGQLIDLVHAKARQSIRPPQTWGLCHPLHAGSRYVGPGGAADGSHG